MRTQVPIQKPQNRSPSSLEYQWQGGVRVSSISKNKNPSHFNTTHTVSYKNHETTYGQDYGALNKYRSLQETRGQRNGNQDISNYNSRDVEFSNNKSAWRSDFGTPPFHNRPQDVDSREPEIQRHIMNSSPNKLMTRDVTAGQMMSGTLKYHQQELAGSQQQQSFAQHRSSTPQDVAHREPDIQRQIMNSSPNTLMTRDESTHRHHQKKLAGLQQHRLVTSQSQYQWQGHLTHSSEQQIASDPVRQTKQELTPKAAGNTRTLRYWEEQQEDKTYSVGQRQPPIPNSAFDVPDVSPLPNKPLADDILSPKSVETQPKKSTASDNCYGDQEVPSSGHKKEEEKGLKQTGETKSGEEKNPIFEISNLFPNACVMPQTNDVKHLVMSATEGEDSEGSYPNDDEYDELGQSQDISESSGDDDRRRNGYDERRKFSKNRKNETPKKGRRSKSQRSRKVVPPRRGNFQQAYDDLMLIDRTSKRNDPIRHQERQRSYPSLTMGSGSNDSTYVSDFTGRQSPSLRQVRAELWGNVDVAGHLEAREPESYVDSSRARDKGKRGVVHGNSDNRSEIPGRSNSSDVFDPFEHETKEQSFQGEIREDRGVLQRSNKPAKKRRDKGKLSKTRQRSQSYGDAREMPENFRPSGEDSDHGLFPFTPDFYMLQELGKEFSGKLTDKLEALNQLKGNQDENSTDSSESSDSSSSNETSDQEVKTQKRIMDYLKRKSVKNVEKLRELEQQRARGQRNLNKDVGPSLVDSDEVSDSEGESKELQAVSAQRPPLAEELRDLRRRKESFDGHYMYVAYSKFGRAAQEILRLCEHEDMPLVNTRNGDILVKVMTSTISPMDCYIRNGKWNEVKLDPYVIPGVAFVGTIQNTPNMTFAHTFSNLKVGDTVMALVKSGSNARYAAVSKEQLVKVPPTLDMNKTVCLPETYLSAFQALHIGQKGSSRYRDDSLAGQTILVLGGSTSLGRALIEIAVAKGANYCYALCKERQFDTIYNMGGIPLPKDPQEWLTLIGRKITTMVAVKDSTGLYTDKLTKDHTRTLTDDGRLVMIGLPGRDKELPLTLATEPKSHKLICRSMKGSLQDRFHPYNVFDSWDAESKQAKKDLEHLLRMLEHDTLRPEVLERVPLSKTSKVHTILETQKVSGHIVCAPWMNDESLQRSTKQPSLAGGGGKQYSF